MGGRAQAYRLRWCFLAISAAAAMTMALPVSDAAARSRTLELYFTHTKEKIKVVYKRNGRYVPSGLRDLNRFLRDWRRNESTKMDPELFDLLWEVQQEVGGKTIHVVSAYRSPATNSMLRRRSRGVARNSQHMVGKAMDFFIPGAKLAKVRAAGMRRQVGGVGYYPRSGSPFVHFDTGRVRSWPRMSRSQLARLFPNGKTLHLPSNGKPLKGYAAAQKAEKAGKLASLSNRGGGRSLFGFGGSGRAVAAAEEPRNRVLKQKTVAKPAKPEPKDEPVKVRTASLGPVATGNDEAKEGGGFFRQLPGASLGGLIGRFRRNDDVEVNVTPVALPDAPLTSVAVDGASGSPPQDKDDAIGQLLTDQPSAASAPAPVPRQAPRELRAPASVPAEAEAQAPFEVAALPPQRPEILGIATDAGTDALGYAGDGRDDLAAASAQTSAAALVPRGLLQPAGDAVREIATGRSTDAAIAPAPIKKAALSPLRGASPLLIADGRGIKDGAFSELVPPDRENASKTGVLLTNGFLGAPRGFAADNAWLDTERFTGVRITVYARPRS